MAQSRYDAIAISEADFYEGPATLSDYMTRLIAASHVSSVPAPTFLASKYALCLPFSPNILPIPLKHFSVFDIFTNQP